MLAIFRCFSRHTCCSRRTPRHVFEPRSEVSAVKRREFCVHACQVVSIAAVAPIVQSCGKNPSSPSGTSAPALATLTGTASGGAVTVALDAASPLASVGGAALVQSAAGSFLVSRTAQEAFTALTATCTHEGCTVTGFQNSRYVCPCHGSQFSTSGAVLQGPASRALQSFATTFTNGLLTIHT
jgi:cytochrome b6-f complex iron-sulfur subunit